MTDTVSPIDRRRLLQGALLGGAGVLAGCATGRGGSVLMFSNVQASGGAPAVGGGFAPIRASEDRLFDITVCLRPFRAAGPRLDTEQIGHTLVVHNYGHGGSGWSLSWGSSTIAVQKAMSASPRPFGRGDGRMGIGAAGQARRPAGCSQRGDARGATT